jgi:gamma-glutamyltranspeptidase/glutathione hydrolase
MPKRRFGHRHIGVACVALLLSACHFERGAQTPPEATLQDVQLAPEPSAQAVSMQRNKQALGATYMAVTANPHASQAANQVLARGGTAVDAAIAAQMVLGLVEPQSSGLGGGGFMLVWDASQQKLSTYDGRETAPLSVDETLFIDADSLEPMSFFNAIIGGRSVGVPGMVKMLDLAHSNHGGLPWSDLFDDARRLATNGFVVSERLHTLIEKVPAVNARPTLASYLFNDNVALSTGVTLKNTAYAETLKKIAQRGAVAFYEGDIAEHIVDVVRADTNRGTLTANDFASYKAVEREPVCKWVFNHKVCGMGPPSSGAITVLSILAMMESAKVPDNVNGINQSADLAHYFVEASRLAFADRNTWLADSDFVDIPVTGLFKAEYLQGRAAQIASKRTSEFSAGVPDGGEKNSYLTMPSAELPSTTHLSIVDQYGNIVSMTTSIESAFGSRLMVDGFILNNQLTDFSFAYEDTQQKKIANRVESGKRPLSSMSPMIVFDKNNNPLIAIGSPGGKSIIGYVARVLYETLALNQNLEQSIADAHIIDIGNRLRLEKSVSKELVLALKAKGHDPELRALTSGLHVIQKSGTGWRGVADARREGIALGQ